MSESEKKRVYLDYAASTPVAPEVLEAMLPYFSEHFGNPNSLHEEGKRGKRAILEARERVSGVLGANEEEVIFTSSGTESNNIAILGTYYRLRAEGREKIHFITTNIEHSSVSNVMKFLEGEGVAVTYVPVDSDGLVDPGSVAQEIREETALVSVMWVNNEIGAIEPVQKIAESIREKNKERVNKILFHTDASQAPLFLPMNLKEVGVDLLTVDAQKIYGPKGSGLLYVKGGVEVSPIMFGGNQEQGLRPSTQNVAGIVGLAKSLEIAREEREHESARLKELQKYFIERLRKEIKNISVNGSVIHRTPNNVNISIEGIEGDYLALLLNERGIAVSAASACHSGSGKFSHVVEAVAGKEKAKGAVRFTMGRDTAKKDIDDVVKVLKEGAK